MNIISSAVPNFECPPDKVPGWLDENGQPQGCVDNNPNPSAPKEEQPIDTSTTFTEVGVPSQPEQLAETGALDPSWGFFGAVLVVAGVLAMKFGKAAQR